MTRTTSLASSQAIGLSLLLFAFVLNFTFLGGHVAFDHGLESHHGPHSEAEHESHNERDHDLSHGHPMIPGDPSHSAADHAPGLLLVLRDCIPLDYSFAQPCLLPQKETLAFAVTVLLPCIALKAAEYPPPPERPAWSLRGPPSLS